LSHYEDVLKEAKEKREKLAVQYIPELYYILRDEQKLQPEDCRARIERDCLDLWSKATISKYLPPEAVNPEKQMAGKIGAKAKKRKKKILVTTDGTTELEESCPDFQMEQDSARTNLAEIDLVNQKEGESRSFHNDLDQQLSSRTISPELLEANRIIADKDRKIEELNETRLQKSSSLFLPNNLTKLIRQFPTTDFILTHDGYEVTSVQPASKDEMSAAADARLPQTGTSGTS
jgi:hypothetical protein